jgi:hypothetical protein
MTAIINNVDDYIQTLSVGELKAWCADGKTIDMNWTDEELEKSQKIYDIMDATEMEYVQVERLLDNPYHAPLSDIHTYCKAMDLDMFEFIKKSLA